MIKNRLILSIILFFPFFLNIKMSALQFLYPVAMLHNNIVFVLQRSQFELDLFFWDQETDTVSKSFLAFCIPAGVQVIPYQAGLSFIDQGRIRILKPGKRSLKTIDIDRPLCNFGLLHWIDQERFCVSAYAKNKHCIFQVDDSGNTAEVVGYEGFDCFYPQKVLQTLFYIDRSKINGEYSIMQLRYPERLLTAADRQYEDFAESLIYQDKPKINNVCFNKKEDLNIIYKSDIPLIALRMETEEKGFFLSYEKQEDNIMFDYCCVKKNNNQTWQVESLFSFSLPGDLVAYDKETALYETIIPFLPYHYKNKIYFSDIFDENVSLFVYDISNKYRNLLTMASEENRYLFAPKVFEDKIFCGFSLYQRTNEKPLKISNKGETKEEK